MSDIVVRSGEHEARIRVTENGRLRLGSAERVALLERGNGVSSLRVDGKTFNVYVHRVDELQFEIWLGHDVIPVTLETPLSRLVATFGRSSVGKPSEYIIRAPMPGLIKDIPVRQGSVVHPGSPIIVLEAMKMENELRATVHATVKRIEAKKQDAVEKGQLLIELEPTEHA